MSEINQVEVLIKPQVPKVIDNQQVVVYIPTATITSVSDDFEIDYGQLKLKNPNVAYTNISNIFSRIQLFELADMILLYLINLVRLPYCQIL